MLCRKAVLALLLTFSAGDVDVVGYLMLYQTFTAHMTGLTAHLGTDVAEAHWTTVFRLAAVVFSFVLGAMAGRACIEITRRAGIRRSATPPLALEAMLIAAAAVAGSLGEKSMGLAYLLAAAMGLQTAVLTRVGSLTVHTTFVTGILNRLAELLSNLAFLTWDVRCGGAELEVKAKVKREALFIFAVWCFYVAGAAAGAWTAMRWSFRALTVPLCILVLTLSSDILQPLPVMEGHQFPET
jgi:uncharacterized membrane protein YoaK (UPF0700 family)